MSIQAIRSGLVNMRILIILLTMVASFISVVGVVIIAKLFGIQPNYFHDPEKILDPNVIVAVLGILIAPIAIVFLTQRYFFKGSIEDLGMKKPFLFPFIQGCAIGFFLKGLATAFTYLSSANAVISISPMRDISPTAWFPYFAWFSLTLFLNSLSEEMAYRTFPITNSKQYSFSKMLAVVVVTASAFSLVHFILEPVVFNKFLYRFSFGVLAGIMFLKRRSLWLIVGLHTGWNFVAIAVSDGSWRTGVLLNTTDFHNEVLFNILVLGFVSLVLIAKQLTFQVER